MIKKTEIPTDFSKIMEVIVDRRKLMTAAGGMALMTSVFPLSPGTPKAELQNTCLDFRAVPSNNLDTVTVPPGYSWHIVSSWGDPLWSHGASFDPQTRGTAESQRLAFGDNNDGMELFTRDGRTIIAINNEYTNLSIMYGNRSSKLPENRDDVAKGQAAVGVTVMEISQTNDTWSVIQDSKYNRRITANTVTTLSGPAAGDKLVQTAFDTLGSAPIGTLNNCGSGRTPWNTYLSCEENFNLFFASSNPDQHTTQDMIRYGLKLEDRGYGWYKYDKRFDISLHPNEVNRFGYILEIDPFKPNNPPKKLSSLGRFKHENAATVVNHDNRIVVYMGDDERGEFLYRFVSKSVFNAEAHSPSPLEKGTLSVAKFDDDGHGTWIDLTPQTTGMSSEAEICIHTRTAGSLVGATTMDRPEWIAVSPHNEAIFCCLTNNKHRGIKPNAGGDPTPIGGPNPRSPNKYGQIIQWQPDNNDHTGRNFTWDMFALAGNPLVNSGLDAGSSNINLTNFFNSPDGLAFDTLGRLWIQTDGNYSGTGAFSGMGNNQMLAANPYTAEIKRFLVGPKECEVTGITWSADRKTMFVGIQHPGELGHSHFPDGGNSVPRSSIIAVRRNDGRIVG